MWEMGFTMQLDLKKGTIPSIRIPEQTFTEQERAGERLVPSDGVISLSHQSGQRNPLCFLPLQQQPLADPSHPTYTRCTQTVSYSPVSSGKDKLRGQTAGNKRPFHFNITSRPMATYENNVFIPFIVF